RVGCTQPRRIAAVSVAQRVAEELKVPLGEMVGYQVRFDEKLCKETRIKFMTDGILLAETQGDPQLRQYGALILDEAHERSLNIDFLLGYLKNLLLTRDDLKVIISSATLDAGSFAEFFTLDGVAAPVIEAPGRMFPVTEFFLPPADDEEMPQHVARAVEWLGGVDPRGDVLVFLPGEREIRECAEVLEGRKFRDTEVLPLFARLGLADQQRVFHPGRLRRLILATNVAETSLTIPRIACVIDSGVARVSRWSPGKGVQRLLVEPVSRASARQRKGRCGRVREGVCVRLYDEAELEERAEFSDPEIRRSSLAGVILRMKSLGLPEIDEFPFLDAPSPKAVAEGYRTLREVGALDRDRKLTAYGREMARMPVDPRLARMIIEARKEHCLAEILPIIGFLESNDPRERPAEKAREADEAHAIWKDAESDFIGILRMWNDLQKFRDERGAWRRNALRKFCVSTYLNMRRVIEWANVVDELAEGTSIELKRENGKHSASENTYPYAAIHRSLLAGVPQQFGLWDRDNKAYRSASGGLFAVFPGSGLFAAPKRWEWVVAMELVETSRLWARRVARIDPDWVEQVAPHLCRSVYGEARWDEAQGAVYGKERVVCGGLAVVNGRRVHYGRVDAKLAHAVFVREGLLGGGLRKRAKFLEFIDELRDEVGAIEDKLRRPGGVWDEDALMLYCEEQIPHEINTAAAFHKWLAPHEEKLIDGLRAMVDEQLQCHGVDGYPDEIFHEGDSYPIYYRTAPGERDDGVTIGVHVDQLPSLPEWLPAWGVDGHLRERVELILRSLPKDYRRACQPIASLADAFVELWALAPKDGPLAQVLSDFIRVRTGADVPVDAYDFSRLPDHLITKIWVCDDEGEELALGTAVAELKLRLGDRMRIRFEAAASADLERSGMSSWDGEKLPERVPIPGGFAYPALVDEQSSVGVRAFVNDHEARESHRAGGARLLCLAHAGEVDHLRKKFPIGLMTKVELPRLGDGGTSIDDLLILTAEGVVGGIFPRSPDGFRELGKSCRGHWFDAAKLLSAALDEIVEAASGISAWIDEHRADRNLGVVAADIHEQLGWLFRERFAWRAGYARLLDYPRRLKAIRSRLGRIKSLPLAKDLEKMQRVRRLWEPWHARWKKDPLNPAHWEVGFILEDWRVAVFAPDLPSPTKVSEKKIEEMLGAAG
ncbi:MAG: hypothetical protein RLZ22_1094, partial [Verrucomicrobiota bacterium]